MKDHKHNKNHSHGQSHEQNHEKSHTQKNAESGSMGYKESKETREEGKRPQTKRGGRHCPNC